MAALSIVVDFNVLEHRLAHLLVSFEPVAMQFLHFQAMEKALGTGIVVTITLGAHAPNQPILFEQVTVIM